MSPHPPPALSQAVTDFESDSEYLSTPVDPPSAGQPHVAEYGPLAGYYGAPAPCDGAEYGGSEHPLPQFRYSEQGLVGASGHPSLLLSHGYYDVAISEDCARADSAMSAYPWLGAAHALPHPQSGQMSSSSSEGPPESSRDSSSPSLNPASRPDGPHAPYGAASLHYPDYDNEASLYGDNVPSLSAYSIARSRQQPNLLCNTNVGYPMAGSQRSHSSPDHNVLPAAASYPQVYYEEGYVDSPVDDALSCNPFLHSGCTQEHPCGYDGQPQGGQPHLDTHLSAAPMQIRHTVRFYQPPSCPYTYPHIDGPLDGPGYSADPLSANSALYHPHSVIHAPRPQQLHDLHNLRDNGCSSNEPPAVLSIPNGPMHPIPRPSSLIEDNPKKPLTLACYFCRKRKIACQSPPANSLDRTCNQCAKRKLKCVYPATSRRGIRPRVYDLQDDRLPRASAPLTF